MAPRLNDEAANHIFHSVASLATFRSFVKILPKLWNRNTLPHLPCVSEHRRNDTGREAPLDTTEFLSLRRHARAQKETVLYLAYGSNLSAEKFRGDRGVNPLAQINVIVPSLVMTFDLPGIPYTEPCFANSKYRTPESDAAGDEKAGLLSHCNPGEADYHKDRWKKGMVGVVYEVTKADYAHIIATEGGGSGYQDVVVDCWALPSHIDTVPAVPAGTPFKVHTLYAPPLPPDALALRTTASSTRRDPSYAQPSARYLKLICDGADELGLPQEYKTYLHGIRFYRVTTARQQLGSYIFQAIWLPIVACLFAISRVSADKDGRYPPWLVMLFQVTFDSVWQSYDLLFKNLFGDGERTMKSSEGDRYRGHAYGSVEETKHGEDFV